MSQYAQISDLQERYAALDLVALSDVNNTGALQPGTINAALVDASSLMDGYIATRYALPIADPTPQMVALACDIALYRLMSVRPLQDVTDARKRYEDAVAVLRDVAKGNNSLGITVDTNREPPQAGDSVVEVGPSAIRRSDQRIFTRKRLRDF